MKYGRLPFGLLFSPLAILLLCSFMLCEQSYARPPLGNVASLLKIIEEDEGRAVYDAFKVIADRANEDDQQAEAFVGLAKYLGDGDRKLTVPDFRPPEFRSTFGHFSYDGLAGEAIIQLGEPARRGLLALLKNKQSLATERAALLLVNIESRAQRYKIEPQGKEFRVLDEYERTALETFLERDGKKLSAYTLGLMSKNGFPTALPHLHHRMKTSKIATERYESISQLGRHAYEPALEDFLTMLRDDPEGDFRSRAADALEKYPNTDRTIPALEAALKNDPEDGEKTTCRNTLAEIRYRLKQGK